MWILNNFEILITFTTVILSPIISYLLIGRHFKNAEIKSKIAESNNVSADYIEKVQSIYDGLVEDLRADRDSTKEFIREHENRINSLQNQFNELSLAYAREVEKSQYWAQKYDELSKKYDELSAEYSDLVRKYEDLRKALDRHKKETK